MSGLLEKHFSRAARIRESFRDVCQQSSSSLAFLKHIEVHFREHIADYIPGHAHRYVGLHRDREHLHPSDVGDLGLIKIRNPVLTWKDQLILIVKSELGVEDNKAHKIPAAEVQHERKESPQAQKGG